MKVCDAGVGSALPAVSVAVTVNVWLPSPSAVPSVYGDVQPGSVVASILHLNVAPASELKLNCGVLLLVGVVIGVSVVSGGVVSTRNVLESEPTLPAAFFAWTTNVCVPSASGAVVNGDAHATGAPSTRHEIVVPLSAVKVKVGVVSLVGVGFLGPPVIVTFGTERSITNAKLAIAPTLPSASVACTSNVCEPAGSAAVVNGDGQLLANWALSTRQRNVEPLSLALYANVGVVSLPGVLGVAVNVVVGAGRVDREAARGGGAGVRRQVGRAHEQRVGAVGEAAERARRGAGLVAAGGRAGSVEAALEGRPGLVGAERELRRGVARRARSGRC